MERVIETDAVSAQDLAAAAAAAACNTIDMAALAAELGASQMRAVKSIPARGGRHDCTAAGVGGGVCRCAGRTMATAPQKETARGSCTICRARKVKA